MSSSKQLFRSGAVIAAASSIGILIGVVKIKLVAVMLGAAGIGLIGFYVNILAMGSTLAGCGISSSGVRELALRNDHDKSAHSSTTTIRYALWFGHFFLGVIGMIALWLMRSPISEYLFENPNNADAIGWLGLGVLFTLIASSQSTILQGLQRVDDIARVNVLSALVSATIGVGAVSILQEDGVLIFVLTVPVVSFLVAGYYVRRLPISSMQGKWSLIPQAWSRLLRLGVPLMGAAFLALATEFAVRSIVLRELGLESSGHFQAVWAISMTYIGFILAAMSIDYFPRLTSIINDRVEAAKLVNEQMEIALLLAGPILLLMISISSWVIPLLYSEDFTPAIELLRWQMLGDILKVSVWPLGFIILAMGRGGLFLATQFLWSAIFFCTTAFGISDIGLNITGVAFWFSYLLFYFSLLYIASRLIGFSLSRNNCILTFSLSGAGATTLYLSAYEPTAGLCAGLLLTVLTGTFSILRLNKLVGIREWVQVRYGK